MQDHLVKRNIQTMFASSLRSSKDKIDKETKLIVRHYDLISQLYDAVSEIVLILDENRQIVFFNRHVPELLKEEPAKLYGMRPGEALDCEHACSSPGGCGTTHFCSQCGAVNAILSALNNNADIRECRIMQKTSGEAFDLLIRTSPLNIDGRNFVIAAITDISHEKRRRMLERIFFHDIMNTALGLKMAAKAFHPENAGEAGASGFKQLMTSLAAQLFEEIRTQKELLAAEKGELKPNFSDVDARELLGELTGVFNESFRECNISLTMDAIEKPLLFKTDPVLIKRVLSNMVKNALEGSFACQTVTVGCRMNCDTIEFSVHNQNPIPPEIQLQIFQRSFSTKGPGRGLGTYSMKLISERYLNGEINFVSDNEHGTVFTAKYPVLASYP